MLFSDELIWSYILESPPRFVMDNLRHPGPLAASSGCSKSRRDVTPLGAVVRKEESRESHLTFRNLSTRATEPSAQRPAEPSRSVASTPTSILSSRARGNIAQRSKRARC